MSPPLLRSYPSLLGIKVVNLVTNQCVRVLGEWGHWWALPVLSLPVGIPEGHVAHAGRDTHRNLLVWLWTACVSGCACIAMSAMWHAACRQRVTSMWVHVGACGASQKPSEGG